VVREDMMMPCWMLLVEIVKL